MILEPKDLELFERIIYKNGDDIAVSIGRSFERLEERIDAAESRIYSRLGEIEEKIDALVEETL
jgi:prefoldin subunit 5